MKIGDQRCSVVIHGFEELQKNMQHLQNDVLTGALDAAQMAAAKIIKNAMVQAAPRGIRKHKWGPIFKEIIIYKCKPKALAYKLGALSRRLLVGPSKDAFYAFFLEKGVGRGGGTQKYKDWGKNAVAGSEADAFEAGKKAFARFVETHLPGGK